MAEGFRAAQAYVEVTSRLDEAGVLASARRAAEGVERELRAGGERAGQGLTGALERAGGDAGEAMVRSTEGRLRDGRGRFIRAGTEVGEGVRRGATDDTDRNGFRVFLGLLKAAPKAGVDAATGLVGALSQGLKGPAGPYLIAGMSAGALVAGPFLGALVAGGIMTGIAGAGIGAGVILAAKDPAVKHAWSQTGDAIGDILTDAASPFKGELIETASRATAAFERWQPLFREIFGTASTMLEPFVDALEAAGDRLLPTIMTTIKAAGPAVDALAGGLSGTVDAVADVVDMLGDNGPEAAVALHAAFFLVQSAIRQAGFWVNALTEGFGLLIEFGLDAMDFFADMGAKLQGLPGALGGIGGQLAALGPVTDKWRGSWEGLKGGIQGATDAGSDGTSKLSDRTQILSLSMGAAIEKAGSLSAAFKLLNGGALNARDAEAAYQAAIDNLTNSVKENGKGLNKQKTDFDLNTAAGRANDAAMRQLISSTDQKAQATYDEVNATKGAQAAQAAASKVYEAGRAQLVKNLTQILGNKTAAEKLAGSIMGIPKSWSTSVGVKDNATPVVNSIKSSIRSINGRTVVVAVKYETHGSVQGEHIIGSGTKTKYASGGEITGGSGLKDDVPVLAMGGEWVIQKAAVRALTRQFGPDFMRELNTWHIPGRSAPSRHIGGEGAVKSGPAPVRAMMGGGSVTYITLMAGAVVLDASRMKSLQDVVELISGLSTTARASRARTATVAGR